MKEALKSLHDKNSEENPFAEATNSDTQDACQPFHLLDIDEEADDIEIYNFYFLTLVNRMSCFLFFFPTPIKKFNETLTQV